MKLLFTFLEAFLASRGLSAARCFDKALVAETVASFFFAIGRMCAVVRCTQSPLYQIQAHRWVLVMSVPHTQYCIFTERLGSFNLPFKCSQHKRSHAFWSRYQTSLFVCLWGKQFMTHRGKYERKNRGRQSSNSLSWVEDSAGQTIWRHAVREEFPQ